MFRCVQGCILNKGRTWPDVTSKSALNSTCEKSGQVEEAFRTFAEMKEERTWPDVTSYSAVIKTCEKCGEVESWQHGGLAMQ